MRRWLDRSFEFGVPLALHAQVRARLAETPARVLDLTRGLSVAALTTRIDGKWSIQDNVGHLLELEHLGNLRLEEYLRGVAVLSAADLTNAATERANYRGRVLAEVLAQFQTARRAWAARLEQLDEATFARTATHPRLRQPLRLLDLMLFVAEHDDHHLERIRELRGVLTALPAGQR